MWTWLHAGVVQLSSSIKHSSKFTWKNGSDEMSLGCCLPETKTPGSGNEKVKFLSLYLLCGMLSEVTDADAPLSYSPDYCQEQRQTISFGAFMFLFPMQGEKKNCFGQIIPRRANVTVSASCCVSSQLTACLSLGCPTSNRVAKEHIWRQGKPSQPSLCALLKAPQGRAANLPALLLSSPQLCQSISSLTGLLVRMVQCNHSVVLLYNEQERRIQKQEPEKRFSGPFIISLGTQSYSEHCTETIERTEEFVLMHL